MPLRQIWAVKGVVKRDLKNNICDTCDAVFPNNCSQRRIRCKYYLLKKAMKIIKSQYIKIAVTKKVVTNKEETKTQEIIYKNKF